MSEMIESIQSVLKVILFTTAIPVLLVRVIVHYRYSIENGKNIFVNHQDLYWNKKEYKGNVGQFAWYSGFVWATLFFINLLLTILKNII